MSSNRITRRHFLSTTVAAGAALAGCSGGDTSGGAGGGGERRGRVVILGFDGVEPSIIQEMINQGELPNYAALQESGSFHRLHTTIPPQSPVAWTSFSTCTNPGDHNIFDFIRRDPSPSYGPFPKVGTGELIHPKFADGGSVSTEAQPIGYRKGTPFWVAADQQGIKCKILNVPFAFPADELANGIQLCALGVPDLRGTTSTYFSLSDAFTPSEMEASLAGGKRFALQFDANDIAEVPMPGPRNTSIKFSEPGDYTTATWTVSVDRKSGQGSVTVDGKKTELKQGVWSEWIESPFKMTGQYTVYGIARFYPIEIGEHVRLYVTCQQFHPSRPYAAFSQPKDYSAELQDRYGLYKTIGWAYDTHALRQDGMDENMFLSDVRQTVPWRERLTLDEIDRGDWDLLVSVWTATDRVGHMFWRFRDDGHPMHDPELAEKYRGALEEVYRESDRIIGEVRKRLSGDDLLMVLSDHGFESWRRGFNVNTWLRDQGYLAVQSSARATGFLQGIDWANTKAYCVGLSSMYLNLAGRERVGTVPPGQAQAMIDEIKGKLLAVKDPATGAKILSNVYTRADYSGQAMNEAPDFSLGYAEYYQTDKTAASGGVGEDLCADNMDKWSGEHAAADIARRPGIFFSNQRVEEPNPTILDLGVTALAYLGADVPAGYEGNNLV